MVLRRNEPLTVSRDACAEIPTDHVRKEVCEAARAAASDQRAVQHVEIYAGFGSEGENLRARRHVDEEQQVEAELDRVAGALFRAIVEDSVRSRYGWA